jgi:hypothetical protein
LAFSNRFQPLSHRPSAPLHADPIAPGDRQPQEVREMRSSTHIKIGLAVTLVLGAIAAPAASAHGAQAGWVVRPNPDEQYPPPAPVIVHVTDPSGGFHWGDAGIGAAGALGLILAATGGSLLLARRRGYSRTRTDVRRAS